VRLTDGEREQFYELLERHAAEGTLSLPELERRVELVARADTREAAAQVLSDLPALLPAPSAPRPERARWGRGHAETERPGADWHATDERFRDPRSGRIMRVWVDGAGARHYVPE
jgi:hypothetical protein